VKKVLILNNNSVSSPENSVNWGKFTSDIDKLMPKKSEITVDVAALSELLFEINNGQATITIPRLNLKLNDYDLVVFRLWKKQLPLAAACTHYLKKHKIRYIDDCIPAFVDHKLTSAFTLWAQGLPQPNSLYGSAEAVMLHLSVAKDWNYPLIIKDVEGNKGKLNFYVASDQELRQVYDENPSVRFIVQEFIPNQGDFRVLTLNYSPALVLHRKAQNGHLNNTSAGGLARFIPTDKARPELLKLARRAALAEQINVAGVDIIEHSQTEELYVLEVNHGPQLSTGAYTDQKMKQYAKMVRELLRSDGVKKAGTATKVVAAFENVDFPKFNMHNVLAKIDTGADSGALHCTKIEETVVEGRKVLCFWPFDHPDQIEMTEEFETLFVKSSNGQREKRYFVSTEITIKGETYPIRVSLANRDQLRYPVLIGRKFLAEQGFLVDVGQINL
jgi:glutathione synthase/RimK-type ligase-like ATP-grasp enzyme